MSKFVPIIVVVILALALFLSTREDPASPLEPMPTPSRTVVASLTTSPSPSASMAERIAINVGASDTISGLTIKPIRVVEDSRCPPEAVCVWEGRAVVETYLADASGSKQVQLILRSGEPSHAFSRYNIKIVDLQPYPTAGVQEPAQKVTYEVAVRQLGDHP